jgi:hypothetical protein
LQHYVSSGHDFFECVEQRYWAELWNWNEEILARADYYGNKSAHPSFRLDGGATLTILEEGEEMYSESLARKERRPRASRTGSLFLGGYAALFGPSFAHATA